MHQKHYSNNNGVCTLIWGLISITYNDGYNGCIGNTSYLLMYPMQPSLYVNIRAVRLNADRLIALQDLTLTLL